MGKRSKRYMEAAEAVAHKDEYGPREAVDLVKETAKAGFDETIEVSLQLGVNPSHADEQVRGTVVLPHGTGKTIRVAAFAKGEDARAAEEAGADLVGAEDLAERIEGGELDFDVTVATPDMMGVVGRLGRVLGPRGLMPNPKAGTVTPKIGDAIREIRAGKVEFRTTKQADVHVPIGKASFAADDLYENFLTLMDAIVRAKPPASKGHYLRHISISSTMGPGIRINPQAMVEVVAGD